MSQDNKKEIRLQSDLPEQGVGFAHRRQVIRGLASIPVAFTLSSGAALANGSSHQCLTKDNGPPPICDSTNISKWEHASVTPAGENESKKCVAYVDENYAGNPDARYYRYDYGTIDNSIKFIDQHGNEVAHTGYPLTTSCATSFM